MKTIKDILTLEQVMRKTAIKPVRKSNVALNWDMEDWQKTTQQNVALPRANVGKDMHLDTDDSALYGPLSVRCFNK